MFSKLHNEMKIFPLHASLALQLPESHLWSSSYLHTAGTPGSRRSTGVWAGSALWTSHRRPPAGPGLRSEVRRGTGRSGGWLRPARSSSTARPQPASLLRSCRRPGGSETQRGAAGLRQGEREKGGEPSRPLNQSCSTGSGGGAKEVIGQGVGGLSDSWR